jgi:hypothetical protein
VHAVLIEKVRRSLEDSVTRPWCRFSRHRYTR